MKREIEKMWDAMAQDVRLTYGMDYLKFYVQCVVEGRPTGSRDVYVVVDVMEDAVTSSHPRCRYLVAGDSGPYDALVVSCQ